MRYILIFWAAPLGFFWGWYFLSYNDISFGMSFFSRQMHDLVFQIYGHILGIDPQIILAMVAKACIFDTAHHFRHSCLPPPQGDQGLVGSAPCRSAAGRSAKTIWPTCPTRPEG